MWWDFKSLVPDFFFVTTKLVISFTKCTTTWYVGKIPFDHEVIKKLVQPAFRLPIYLPRFHIPTASAHGNLASKFQCQWAQNNRYKKKRKRQKDRVSISCTSSCSLSSSARLEQTRQQLRVQCMTQLKNGYFQKYCSSTPYW